MEQDNLVGVFIEEAAAVPEGENVIKIDYHIDLFQNYILDALKARRESNITVNEFPK